MKTTFWKLTTTFTAVLCLIVFGAALSPAEPPDGKGPPDGMGGPPPGTMMDVAGCAYFDEVLGVWRLRDRDLTQDWPACLPEADTDWKIDFGPEGYCPDPCLTGELITDVIDDCEDNCCEDGGCEIKIGRNYVGTFKYAEDGTTILAQTDEDGPAFKVYNFIPLLPAEGTNYGRPIDGKWVRVFGRAGETEYAVLAWELRYPNTLNLPTDYGKWFWWRSTGQPWAKMWLLDCVSPGEEEEPSSSKGGGGNGKGH